MEAEDDTQTNIHVFIFCVVMSIACVVIAALAAGLTLGMLSLDPLWLAVKMGRGVSNNNISNESEQDEEEKGYAETIYPLVKDHHRLLVTLLLLNSVANESLPLFLDQLGMPAYVSVILSVTLVLMFGEIVPSAVFTGKGGLRQAAKLAPFVRCESTFIYVFCILSRLLLAIIIL